MRVAALYDIHGNLPALAAVLDEVVAADVDAIVIGGDVVTGPLPGPTLERLMDLSIPVHGVRGNADREVLEAYDAGRLDPDREADVAAREAAFSAAGLARAQRDHLAGYAPSVVLDLDGLGPTRFCHATPRTDDEIVTMATPSARLEAILAGVAPQRVVGGHTHRQFERLTSGHHWVNPGSVGRPYEGRPGAFWAVLGPEVSLRRTAYDVAAAAEEMCQTGFPGVEDFLNDSLLDPLDADAVAASFEAAAAGESR